MARDNSLIEYSQRIAESSYAEEYIELLHEISDIYDDPSFLNAEPVVRAQGTTLYTTSGVQAYTELFEQQAMNEHSAGLFSQPVIRINHLDGVALGSYVSFINFGAMQTGVSAERNAEIDDAYFEVLKAANDQKVERGDISEFEKDVGNVRYETTQRNYFVDNLDVGDVLFHRIIVPKMGSLALSEVGGGFERYFFGRSGSIIEESTGIPTTADNVRFLDTIRTAVLMVANGVTGSNNNHGYQFRKVAKRMLAEDCFDDGIVEYAFEHTFNYWQNQRGTSIDVRDAKSLLMAEVWRHINIASLKSVGRSAKSSTQISLPPNDFKEKYQV